MKYIYLLIGILMIGTVTAYVAQDPTNVILTLDETTYYSASDPTNVILTLDVTPPDTCTAPESGIWEVDCADYCNITSNVNIGTESIILAGTGHFTILADVSAGLVAVGPNCALYNTPDDGNTLNIRGDGL